MRGRRIALSGWRRLRENPNGVFSDAEGFGLLTVKAARCNPAIQAKTADDGGNFGGNSSLPCVAVARVLQVSVRISGGRWHYQLFRIASESGRKPVLAGLCAFRLVAWIEAHGVPPVQAGREAVFPRHRRCVPVHETLMVPDPISSCGRMG